MKEPTIITFDPSFTAWGYAVLDYDNNVIAAGCIKTEPDHKKRRIRKSDDRTRRAEDITRQLLRIMKQHNVNYILSELPHGSQNAQAAIMMGIVVGIVVGISECLNIPAEYYSEQDAKKALLNKRTATKAEIIKVIKEIYNVKWTGTKYKDEAIADSLAIHHAASTSSPTIKILKR